nr:odorant-binding protein 15 [Lytta caraganae]
MFKYSAILALCLYIPAVLSISDEMKELSDMLHGTCVAETGVDESLISKVNNEKVMPDDANLKCYIKCLLTQMAIITDDGDIDVEATVAVLPDEMRKQCEPAIRSCGTKRGADLCETAWLTHKCYLETSPSGYFLV